MIRRKKKMTKMRGTKKDTGAPAAFATEQRYLQGSSGVQLP